MEPTGWKSGSMSFGLRRRRDDSVRSRPGAVARASFKFKPDSEPSFKLPYYDNVVRLNGEI